VAGRIRIVGLGPAALDRIPDAVRAMLLDDGWGVVVRTLEHPAAAELAALRNVEACDDLYRGVDDFESVYAAIAERVMQRAAAGPVVYAVPGSPTVGERAVRLIGGAAAEAGITVEIQPGESFLGLALDRAGIDPLARGVQVIDAHDLPDPLLLHLPTVVAQVDTPGSLFEVRDSLLALVPPDTAIIVLTDLGAVSERVDVVRLEDLRPEHAGLRVSLAFDVDPPGWPGLVRTNALLRLECPWDRRQTHHTLSKHLLEEAHEVLEAIEALPPEAPARTDAVEYGELQEELGDLLLQVVFHATLAAEAGGFGVEEVAETIRRKLVARHPHVFGDVDAATAEEVMANWETLKQEEKGRESVLDGVSRSLPGLARAFEVQARAASVGFDWDAPEPVIAKVREELDETLGATSSGERHHEVGDLLFSVVNLARHLGVDAEQSMRSAVRRFEERFRSVEVEGLAGKTLAEMDEAWERAKRRDARPES
jgi:tetrapyrrole methylase family protein/MazG family protein